MPTKNPRLNVVLDPGIYVTLHKVAKDEGISMSLVARDLIKDALEMYEDKHWDKKAAARDKTMTKKATVSHEEAWK